MAGKRGGAIARMVPDGMLTTSMLADKAGMSQDTIKRWRDEGVLPARKYMTVGQLLIYLYTMDDLKLAKQLKSTAGSTVQDRLRKIKQLPLAS